MTRSWKQYEGQRISETFPLHRYLGGEGNHAVFLTEHGEPAEQKSAIKIILGDPDVYPSRPDPIYDHGERSRVNHGAGKP